MSPLDRNPGRHVHFSRLDWWRIRLPGGLRSRLTDLVALPSRAALPRRPARQPARRGSVRVQTRLLGPEGPAVSAAGRGTAPSPTGAPAEGAVPLARTRGDLVIYAGGMLLPDRLRDDPEPMPFRIPPYYLLHEAEQAARGWFT